MLGRPSRRGARAASRAARRMARFWDRSARRNALHFVDDRQPADPAAIDEEEFWRRGREDLQTLLDSLGLRLAGVVTALDLGCGVGRLTRELAAHCERVIAIDVSGEMLARARAANPRLEGVEWVLGDGVSLSSVPEASVDAVVSHVVLQHIPDPGVTLGYVREIGRVLRPGGWAALQVSNDPCVHRAARDGPARRRRRFARVKRRPEWTGSAVALDELAAVAVESGMDVERIENPGTQFCLVALRRSGGPA